MSRTITAMFKTRADAEAARDRLTAAGIHASNVNVVDQSTSGYSTDSYSRASTTTEHRGIWASIKNAFLPDEDRHTYEEGVRRGHVVLTADVDEDRADEAVRALEDANSIDIDEETASWRKSGWTGPATAAGLGTGVGAAGLATDRDRLGTTGTTGEAIPIVEEQLTVGKREVNRGGVRVRSYVTEKPVSEQVTLRDEHVSVERRAVNQPLSAADGDAFRERTIELTETGEEAVVGKTARVVEEVVLSKDVGTRTETVTDTVRRTDVEVENLTGATTATGAGRGSLLDRDGDGKTELTDRPVTGRGGILDRDGDGRTELTDGVGVKNPLGR